MPRDDWFRRSTWTSTDEAEFFGRLHRARSLGNRSQYLRIQASHLADAGLHSPAIALLDLLLSEYPSQIEVAAAHLQKAESLAELNQTAAAVDEFRAALQSEREFPNVKTGCWLLYPWFIVERRLTNLYDESEAILDEFLPSSRLTFPVERYRFAGVKAILAQARGELELAKEYAIVALQAARAVHSGFVRHPTIGLVHDHGSRVRRELVVLAR